ncbi:MAG TPA: response regulator [Dongiaceae bacterium]|nr:response regulator [Dongiaceae bacterium]
MTLSAQKNLHRRIRRPEDLERVSIVAIEGITAMVSTLSGVLRSFRFSAVEVINSSEEAWARLTGEPRLKADIFLLDWDAHPINGEEFTRRLRRLEAPQLAELPIIGMIAGPDRPTVLAARDCGMNALLLRPFSATQLMERVIWTLSQDTPFIRSEHYVGPDRRRFRTAEYLGERRRSDDFDAPEEQINQSIA